MPGKRVYHCASLSNKWEMEWRPDELWAEGWPAGGPGTILLAALPLPALPPPRITWLVLVLLQTPQRIVSYLVIKSSFPQHLSLRVSGCLLNAHSGVCPTADSAGEEVGWGKKGHWGWLGVMCQWEMIHWLSICRTKLPKVLTLYMRILSINYLDPRFC